MILEEFDPCKEAIINPWNSIDPVEDFPDTVISIFSKQLFEKILAIFPEAKKIGETHDVDGVWPVYELNYGGYRFAYAKARVGASSCVGFFEDMLGMGGKRILLLGNCGVLDDNIEDCGIIIPTKAIRDEGTSYHYAPAADMIDVNHKYVDVFEQMLDELGYSYTEGITWTTDGFYRETRAKMERRKAMGAITVEMECSAMQAMCDFRGIEFFQFLYAGDSLAKPEWDPRSLSGNVKLSEKEKIAMLLFELAVRIETITKDE